MEVIELLGIISELISGLVIGSSNSSYIQRDFWGNPLINEGFFGGRTIKVGGKTYDVITESSDRLVVREQWLFGAEKIIDRSGFLGLGDWQIRDRGIFD